MATFSMWLVWVIVDVFNDDGVGKAAIMKLGMREERILLIQSRIEDTRKEKIHVLQYMVLVSRRGDKKRI